MGEQTRQDAEPEGTDFAESAVCHWPYERCSCGMRHVQTHPQAGCADVGCTHSHERPASRAIWSDQALSDIAIVQQAMDDWRRAYNPADDRGPTMAESIVLALAQRGRL